MGNDLGLKWFGKDSEMIDLEETRRRIKILQRKLYKCCGTKMSLCLKCFDVYHKLEDLKDYREELKKFASAKQGETQ